MGLRVRMSLDPRTHDRVVTPALGVRVTCRTDAVSLSCYQKSMNTPASPDVLLLDLVLVGIDEGVITCEADLARLYTWLCLQATSPDQTAARTWRKTTADPRPGSAARAGGRIRKKGTGPA